MGIIWQFRQKSFGTSANIEAMFLQMEVPVADAKCLRFVWRETQSDDMSTNEKTRHIFGAKDSPTFANYALQRTATDIEDKLHDVSKIIKRNFYMDDFLYSDKSTQKAEILKQNLITFSKRGGLSLSKGQSNVKDLCEKDSDVYSVTVLGLEWNLARDGPKLSRGFACWEISVITHRVVLSVSLSNFDPLGLPSPFTVRIRLILQ